jgi:HAD superfamily hydrolase (TIGR01509 family)
MAMQGFVFDFDGLILDTETPLFNTYKRVFAEYGYNLTLQEWSRIIGTGHTVYDPLDHLVQVAGDHHDRSAFARRIDREVGEILQSQPAMPGVVAFIEGASAEHIPMAVCSSSSRAWVQGHLQRIQLLHHFQQVVTLDDVTMPKPDPQLYLLAASHLGLLPEDLVAFEDSLNGVRAAKAAGLYCIAVPNEMTRSMNLELADQVVSSFLELSLDNILSLTPGMNNVRNP